MRHESGKQRWQVPVVAFGHFIQQLTEIPSIEKNQQAVMWVVQGKLYILADPHQPAIAPRTCCSSSQLLQQMHHLQSIVSVPV